MKNDLYAYFTGNLDIRGEGYYKNIFNHFSQVHLF